jgi:hypothetical protein
MEAGYINSRVFALQKPKAQKWHTCPAADPSQTRFAGLAARALLRLKPKRGRKIFKKFIGADTPYYPTYSLRLHIPGKG